MFSIDLYTKQVEQSNNPGYSFIGPYEESLVLFDNAEPISHQINLHGGDTTAV